MRSVEELLEQERLEIHHTLLEMSTFRYDYYGFHIRFNRYASLLFFYWFLSSTFFLLRVDIKGYMLVPTDP